MLILLIRWKKHTIFSLLLQHSTQKLHAAHYSHQNSLWNVPIIHPCSRLNSIELPLNFPGHVLAPDSSWNDTSKLFVICSQHNWNLSKHFSCRQSKCLGGGGCLVLEVKFLHQQPPVALFGKLTSPLHHSTWAASKQRDSKVWLTAPADSSYDQTDITFLAEIEKQQQLTFCIKQLFYTTKMGGSIFTVFPVYIDASKCIVL